jgi:preprotein translocase subunit SecA
MIKTILRKIFGTRNQRLLKVYAKTVAKINKLESSISQLTDTELQNKTTEFKQRYLAGESLESILPEAFAVCREASVRTIKLRHFDVQLVGGMVLNDGKIAEMKTGEGKTLVATLPAYLNALSGDGVHVVTVNDYLARRDATDLSPLYNFLGLTVGINLPDMSTEEKRQAYAADITYGTNNEYGFDYLRDNMVFDTNEKVQRPLNFAIVDEVDSILIDEARTPLIISGPAEGSDYLYIKLNKVPPLLTRQEKEDSADGDFWVDEKNNNAILSEAGHEKVERILVEMNLLESGSSLYDIANISKMHHLLSALKAHYVYHIDQQYVVQNGEVVIIDEFTGRLMSGRRWSDGLHQAVEAKEGVEIQRENQTMATITFQNYFRMYKKLSGMTGTADTEAYEFQQIYALETVVIPTNQPMVRIDLNDKIYMNLPDKYQAIIEEIRGCSEHGQPVLVGTTSVENSEIISQMLTKAGLKHAVLNAKQHAKEAEIIVQAGSPGTITVATNMAGRGTDIILGGNPKPQIAKINSDDTLSDVQKQQQIEQVMLNWQELHNKVIQAGGLCIVGTERHESRRIDNQLRGRSGRQGDPGRSIFYLSLDDQLLRVFGGERMRSMMQRLGMAPGESIEHKWLSRSIESAQRKVEGHNFDMRKQLLDYDNVSNEQRKVIYQQRDEILLSRDLSDLTLGMIGGVLENNFDTYIPHKSGVDDWNISDLERILQDEYLLDYSITDKLKTNPNIHEDDLKTEMTELAHNKYKNKMVEFAAKVKQDISNFVNGLIGEDKTSWAIQDLDDFCAQNGITLSISFKDYVDQHPEITRDQLIEYFNEQASDLINNQVTRFERGVLLQHIDYYWRDHLTQLDQLRQGIHLRGYAQKDPKQEYKRESFELFSGMLDNIKRDAAKVLLTVRLQSADDIPRDDIYDSNRPPEFIHNELQSMFQVNKVPTDNQNVGRNSPCPCGSGKKYKQCCGKLT